ncbi:MAG: hypothetical protein LC790_16610, partial [Actinobacteria bacterium]|nr:hypothetical protein [Actinomycetota bacterium]
CEQLDAQRGRSFLYTAIEYELALLAGRLYGSKTTRELRCRLADDEHERDRVLLSFTPDRTWKGPARKRRVGVPSEASFCRHRQRVPEDLRLEILRDVFHELRDELLALFGPIELVLVARDWEPLTEAQALRLAVRKLGARCGLGGLGHPDQ